MTSEYGLVNSTATPETTLPSPLAVLVVDDDAALRNYLVDVLEGQGLRVVFAYDQASALAGAASESELAVVVLDLGLPPYPSTMTEGLATLKVLLGMRPRAKVLVLTGQDEAAAARAVVRDGAFDFLTKPASLAQVLQSVQRALLFFRQEDVLAREGCAKLQLTALVTEGPREAAAQAEEQLVRRVMAQSGNKVAEAARRLGLAREHMYYYLNKYGIKRTD